MDWKLIFTEEYSDTLKMLVLYGFIINKVALYFVYNQLAWRNISITHIKELFFKCDQIVNKKISLKVKKQGMGKKTRNIIFPHVKLKIFFVKQEDILIMFWAMFLLCRFKRVSSSWLEERLNQSPLRIWKFILINHERAWPSSSLM